MFLFFILNTYLHFGQTLQAKIKNASDYTFLKGQSSIYVDGSFISKSDVPLVSPEESFDCPLGYIHFTYTRLYTRSSHFDYSSSVDPSIRVTYHPRSKKVSQSGFYTKTTNYVFSQRITIFNTKTLPIENLKIIDQAPVSEDSDIIVKLVNPALKLPVEAGGPEPKALPSLRVASGVLAHWHGADEEGAEVDALGKDGKLNWVCAIPSQEKIGLVLQWEVTAPVKSTLVGLT